MLNFFANAVTDEWGTSYQLTAAGYTVLAVAMLFLLFLACFIGGTFKKSAFSTRQLVYSSMAVAAAMVASYLKLFKAPMGGSVTLLSMLFICMIGYWYGLRTGVMCAIAYGLLQLLADPYIISLPQMLTDYIFAFGALGLSGLFCSRRNGLVKGYLAGVLGRYFFAFLSGMIFFGTYASDYGMTAPVYSLLYNGSYLLAEAAVTLVFLTFSPVKKVMGQLKSMAHQ